MRYGRELPEYPFNFTALLTRGIIVFQRKLFSEWLPNSSDYAPLDVRLTIQETHEAIQQLLHGDSPCLVARFGSGEMEATLRYLDVTADEAIFVKGIKLLLGKRGPFWWDNSIRGGLVWGAGFFPPTNEALNQFGKKVIEDCGEIDLLGSWLSGEKRIQKTFAPNMKAASIESLNPFFAQNPWTQALAEKKVLVVHPFTKTILQQFKKRAKLFENPLILPEFELLTYKPVVTLAGNESPFVTWFDALNAMNEEISKLDFDIAIVAAGAYGMSLAANIKRTGRKAVHLGGATQILFGIKGRRWDQNPAYSALYNEHWTRPLAEDTPPRCQTVEGCPYW